jgi:hypothetical protein
MIRRHARSGRDRARRGPRELARALLLGLPPLALVFGLR